MKKVYYLIIALTIIAVIACAICAKMIWDRVDKKKSAEPETRTEDTVKVEEPIKPEVENKQTSGTEKGYADIIEQYMKDVPGDVQWGYKLFSANEEDMTESKAVPSASVIKVFIMEYAFDQIGKGELKLTDELSGGTVESLVRAMITRSDNDATNTLIETFGMEKMNQFIQKQGYQDTKIQRKMLDTEAQKEGRDNFTSVKDVMKFLDKLYQNRDQEHYRSMMEIMTAQEVRTKIPLKFPPDVVIANKTGELSNVENDIGILFGQKGDYAIAFLCSDLADTAMARNAISEAAYQFYLAAEK